MAFPTSFDESDLAIKKDRYPLSPKITISVKERKYRFQFYGKNGFVKKVHVFENVAALLT